MQRRSQCVALYMLILGNRAMQRQSQGVAKFMLTLLSRAMHRRSQGVAKYRSKYKVYSNGMLTLGNTRGSVGLGHKV